jgi:hypothetical protein
MPLILWTALAYQRVDWRVVSFSPLMFADFATPLAMLLIVLYVLTEGIRQASPWRGLLAGLFGAGVFLGPTIASGLALGESADGLARGIGLALGVCCLLGLLSSLVPWLLRRRRAGVAAEPPVPAVGVPLIPAWVLALTPLLLTLDLARRFSAWGPQVPGTT